MKSEPLNITRPNFSSQQPSCGTQTTIVKVFIVPACASLPTTFSGGLLLRASPAGVQHQRRGTLFQKRTEANTSQENESKAPYHLLLKREHSNSQFHQENCWGKSRQWKNCQNHFFVLKCSSMKIETDLW